MLEIRGMLSQGVTFSNLRKSLVLASDPSLQERARAARATDRSDNGSSNQSNGDLFIFDLLYFPTHFHCVHDCFMIFAFLHVVQVLYMSQLKHCIQCVHCPNDFRFSHLLTTAICFASASMI